MFKRNCIFLTACLLLAALLLSGLGAAAVADTPSAELHVEKDGRPLDLSLKKLAVEDGNLVITVAVDRITEWGDEEPPRLIVLYKSPYLKLETSLFGADTVQKLPSSARNYKVTLKFPQNSDTLPDQLLLDIGEGEPLVFWQQEGGAAATATPKPTATPTPKPTATPKPTPKPTATPVPGEAELAKAEKLIDQGKYYEAALAIRDAQDQYSGSYVTSQGDSLMARIQKALAGKEPKTGELERHFPYYGANCVYATAESFPFEMTITDVNNSSQFVRFYVRQGDTSEIYLPSSHYYVVIKTGDIWFNDRIGFGELGFSSDFGGDTLDMTSRSNGNTLNYHTWSPVF